MSTATRYRKVLWPDFLLQHNSYCAWRKHTRCQLAKKTLLRLLNPVLQSAQGIHQNTCHCGGLTTLMTLDLILLLLLLQVRKKHCASERQILRLFYDLLINARRSFRHHHSAPLRIDASIQLRTLDKLYNP